GGARWAASGGGPAAIAAASRIAVVRGLVEFMPAVSHGGVAWSHRRPTLLVPPRCRRRDPESTPEVAPPEAAGQGQLCPLFGNVAHFLSTELLMPPRIEASFAVTTLYMPPPTDEPWPIA